MESYIEVKHNFEAAHRLLNLKGRCENIHGHSFWATLRLYGGIDDKGILTNFYGKKLDFGEVKRLFRGFLDVELDHRLLLNEEDPWSRPVISAGVDVLVPGLKTFDTDPTTEYLAVYIAEWAQGMYGTEHVSCHVQETAVNAAGIELGGDAK